MRLHHRLRFCGLAAPLLLAPLASAQSPLPVQGLPAPAEPRPAIQISRPTGPSTPKPGSTPSLLTPKVTDKAVALAPPLDLKLTRFDPHATQVRLKGRNWQLCSGAQILKDFGENREAAYEARRLVAQLKLTERGAIGTPQPVMEYWLSEGHAPPVPSFSRSIIPFDVAAVQVVANNGVYYVGDGHQVLFNFGPHEGDAKQAVAVIKQYGFNELGFVGLPTPSMTYLLKNDNPRRSQTRPGQTVPQQSPRHPLEIAGLGIVGERRAFDNLRLDLRKSADGWHLTAGPHDLGAIGNNEHQARIAMHTIQRYPLTERVTLGTGDFVFFLSHGEAPRGVPLGVRRTPFEPRELAAKKTGNAWTLGDRRQTVGTFTSAEEANTALKVIQHYGFNCLCDAGPGLHYLARD